MDFLFYSLRPYASYLYQKSEQGRERKMSQEHLVKWIWGWERDYGDWVSLALCSLHAFTSPEAVSYRLSDTDMSIFLERHSKHQFNNIELFLEVSLNCHLFLHTLWLGLVPKFVICIKDHAGSLCSSMNLMIHLSPKWQPKDDNSTAPEPKIAPMGQSFLNRSCFEGLPFSGSQNGW